jgi:tRNA-dihydrouridine synthase C
MLGRGALADPHLARRVAAELGLIAAAPEPDRPADWVVELNRLREWTPGFDGMPPQRAVLRLKQWLRMAAAFGTFDRFDAVKRARSPAEVFAVLRAA